MWWLIYSKQHSKYTNNISKSIICIKLGTRNIFFIRKLKTVLYILYMSQQAEFYIKSHEN